METTMIDDQGRELQPGDTFEAEMCVDESTIVDVGQEETVYEGEYLITVPEGQKAIIRYELAASEGKSDEEMDVDTGAMVSLRDGG